MKRSRLCTVLTLVFLMFPNPPISAKTKNELSFSAEEMEIYASFFNKFLNEHKVVAVLVDKTDRLKLSESDLRDRCMSGIELPGTPQTRPFSHSLGSRFVEQVRPTLVDPTDCDHHTTVT